MDTNGYEEYQERGRKYWSERQEKKDKLIEAMATRVLTVDEHREALAFGKNLVIEVGMSYKESDKHTEWLELWYQQARLRALKDHKK